jgi:hypothetical protein
MRFELESVLDLMRTSEHLNFVPDGDFIIELNL